MVGCDTMDCHDNGCSSLSFNLENNRLKKKKEKLKEKREIWRKDRLPPTAVNKTQGSNFPPSHL